MVLLCGALAYAIVAVVHHRLFLAVLRKSRMMTIDAWTLLGCRVVAISWPFFWIWVVWTRVIRPGRAR